MADNTKSYMGRYQVIEKLGEGGMAAVYKARDTRLDREVALKVITDTRQGSEHFLKRFEREARSLAKLSHPNIVKVHDYGEHEGMPFIVMEYLPNGTLKKFMSSPLPFKRAAQLLLPVAEALDYAHQQGIVHRDIKPANILLSAQDIPMVTDFGIAKVLSADTGEQLTQVGSGIGTPSYMSPEQGQGQDIDQRADIYALGVVLYEMLTSRKPYEAPTPTGVFWKQMSEPLPDPRLYAPTLPGDVVGFLKKALAVNVNERVQTMQEFAAQLRALSDSTALHPSTAPALKNTDNVTTQLLGAAPLIPSIPPAQNRYDDGVQLPPEIPQMPSTPAYTPPVSEKKKKPWVTFAIIGAIAVVGVICIIGVLLLLGILSGDPEATPTQVAQQAEQQPVLATRTPQPTETPPQEAPPAAGGVTAGGITYEEFQACLTEAGYEDYTQEEGFVPVLCDTFDDNRFSWYLESVDHEQMSGSAAVSDGALRLTMTGKENYAQMWQYINDPAENQHLVVGDILMAFRIRKVSEGGDGFFGVDYRETVDYLFYSLTFYETDRLLTLEFYDSENYTNLIETTVNDWDAGGWNEMAIAVSGSNHFGGFNSADVEINDSSILSAGKISIFIGSVNAGEPVIYEIDDLIIYQIQP